MLLYKVAQKITSWARCYRWTCLHTAHGLYTTCELSNPRTQNSQSVNVSIWFDRLHEAYLNEANPPQYQIQGY